MACLRADGALAQETPADIVAVAVRQNGYVCDEPATARPDPEHTSPDEKAWIIRCDTKTYRVKFVGDASVEVVPLNE